MVRRFWIESHCVFYQSHVFPGVGFQHAGDIVYLKGSTLHWVRSLGFATHISWNIGALDSEQLGASLTRSRINDELTLSGSTFPSVIPMRTLLFDIARLLNDFTKAKFGRGLPKTFKGFCTQTLQRTVNDPQLLREILTALHHAIGVFVKLLAITSHCTGLKPREEIAGSQVMTCCRTSCQREVFQGTAVAMVCM